MFKITKIIIGSNFVDKFKKIGFLSQRKNKILADYNKIKAYGMKIDYDDSTFYWQLTNSESSAKQLHFLFF